MLDCASCHVNVVIVYYVACFFPVLLLLGILVTLRLCGYIGYVRLSSSWIRSSSLRDLRQDDHTLEITSIFALLDARSFALPML